MMDKQTENTKPIRHGNLDPGLIGSLTSAVLRRINVSKIAASSGHADAVAVDEVSFDDAQVQQVNIENLATNVKCGSAILKNVRLILELRYTVDWSYDFGWLGKEHGTKTLGSKAKPIPLHDIRIPMLEDIALNIPEAEVEDIDAEIQPVNDLNLGGINFENANINNTNLPSDGFSISGMDFDSVEVESFGVPASDSETVSISTFSPSNAVVLPTVSVKNIDIPAVEIDDISSDGAVSIMDIQPEEFAAPVFKIGHIFKAWFVTTPVLHFQIGELVLSDLLAAASIGCVQVNGASAAVTANGIKLDGLELNDLTINNIKI